MFHEMTPFLIGVQVKSSYAVIQIVCDIHLIS